MTFTSRRILLFAATFVGSLGLLAVLLFVFAQPPQPTAPTSIPPTSPPKVIATIDDEPITADAWQQAVALDQAMSELVGQDPPGPEETLNRLINELLVLRAAKAAGLRQADGSQAEAWLMGFLASWDLDDSNLEQTLNSFGLTRAELENEIIPRLLWVESALAELPPSGDAEAWVADLRSKAKVTLLENLYAPLASNIPLATQSASPTRGPSGTTPSRPTARPAGPVAGELAPDFSLETVDRTTVRLSEEHGKPIVLYFWATWCTPCIEGLSGLETSEREDFVILSIAVREPFEKVAAFVSDRPMEVSPLLDLDGRVSDMYGVRGLPTSLFIDRAGVIAARQVGPFQPGALNDILDVLAAPSAPAAVP
jgi:peroxiredoxin